MSSLPVEIVDQILGLLPDIPIERQALKSCSLVCRTFLHCVRPRLFRHINLYDSSPEPTKLENLLQWAPHLVQYVQELRIVKGVVSTGVGLFSESTRLPASLKALKPDGSHHVALKSIQLHRINWENISSGMRAAMLDLLACSSLCHVLLRDVSGYPANLIDRLSHTLKSLEIIDTDVPLNKNIRPLLRLEALTIHLTVGSSKQEKVDNTKGCVTRLRSLNLSLCNRTLWPVYRAIVQHTSSSLEELNVLINITAEYFTSVELGRFPRIRNVAVITPRLRSWSACSVSFRAAIIWLSQSLKDVSHDNKIESVTIRFFVAITHGHVWDAAQFGAGIDSTIWKGLDATLSQPNLASSKTFRGINLQFCSDRPDLHDYLNELVHANLPRTARSEKLHVKNQRFDEILYAIERP